MSGAHESFKINLNQNLWGLISSFGALGLAEHYHLCTLYVFSVVAAIAATGSFVVTTYAYAMHYRWKKNLQRTLGSTKKAE